MLRNAVIKVFYHKQENDSIKYLCIPKEEKKAYIVAQEIDKGEIYQIVQSEEPAPTEASSTAALHHRLFQAH